MDPKGGGFKRNTDNRLECDLLVREQVDSNLIGLHVVAGLPATEQMTTQLTGPFSGRAIGLGDPAVQAAGVLADFVGREAYVLAYIDAFWLIAWVSLLGILC